MSGRHDFARDGFIAVAADPSIPKKKRGEALTTFAIATAEETSNGQDYGGRYKATAANSLLLLSNQAKNGPRGEAGGLAMGGAPAIRLNGKYRPLLTSASGDDDFELVTATPIVNGRPGIPPDGTIGYLVNTTRHGDPETLALHSGPGGGPGGADLIAHHEGNTPPVYSSMVADISGDSINPLRTAGLHTIFRVRSMVDGFCKGATASSNTGPNSVYLNGTKSVGDHTGWLPTTYATYDALHSHEVGGNQRPATTHHELGYTPEGRLLVSGANDCDTLWTRGDPKHDSPLEILDQDEPDEISLGLFPHRTWCMTDRDETHKHLCDPKKEQLRRWHTPLPITLKPSCFSSRDTVALDANGNPGRTFSPGPEVYAPTAFEGTGMRFISRPNILAGKPSVPYAEGRA